MITTFIIKKKLKSYNFKNYSNIIDRGIQETLHLNNNPERFDIYNLLKQEVFQINYINELIFSEKKTKDELKYLFEDRKEEGLVVADADGNDSEKPLLVEDFFSDYELQETSPRSYENNKEINKIKQTDSRIKKHKAFKKFLMAFYKNFLIKNKSNLEKEKKLKVTESVVVDIFKNITSECCTYSNFFKT